MSFGLRFVNGADGVALNAVAIQPPKMSFARMGGARDATITMSGQPEALYDLMGKLGADVAISHGGTDVWHGYLNEASLTMNHFVLRANLDDMANAIRCVYTSHMGGHVVASGSTGTRLNLPSVAKFGRKELVLELAEGSPQQADNYVQRELEKRAWPAIQTEPTSGGETKLELYCRGHFYKLGWSKPIVESNGAAFDTADGLRYSAQTFVDNPFPAEHPLGDTSGNMEMYATLQVEAAMPVGIKSIKIKLRKTLGIIESLRLDIGVGPAGGFTSLAFAEWTGIGDFEDTLSKFFWPEFVLDNLWPAIPYQNYTMKLTRLGSASSSSYFIVGIHPSLQWANGSAKVMVDMTGEGL